MSEGAVAQGAVRSTVQVEHHPLPPSGVPSWTAKVGPFIAAVICARIPRMRFNFSPAA
jgi:hypothetical protein